MPRTSAAAPRRRKGGWLKKLLLLTGGLALGALAAEGLLRLVAPQVFPVHPPGLYVLDDEVGYTLAPGFEGRLRRAEFDVTVRVDANGLRRTEPAPAGEGPPLRVLCLGDSQTFGFGVEDGETFASRLQSMLAAAHPTRRVTVMNAGVPGYGTADELAWLRARGPALAPDLVILQFLPNNDFVENRAPAATWAGLRNGMLVTRAGADDDGTPLVTRAKRFVKNHSHLARLLLDRAGYLLMRWGALDAFGGVTGESGEDFNGEDARLTGELLDAIVAECRRLGAGVLFLYTTGQDRVIAEESGPLRSRDFLRETAAAAGVPWLDVADDMKRRGDRLELYYPQDGHWTTAGHRTVARLLADEIVRLGLLPPASGDAPGRPGEGA